MTKNPPTLIHRPFANATSAKAITKFGNMAVTRTTRDSAAARSRNIHITQVKKASPVGRKLESQYEIIENRTDIITVNWLEGFYVAGWAGTYTGRASR